MPLVPSSRIIGPKRDSGMILPTMTAREICDEIEKDRQKILYKIDFFRPKAVKFFSKAVRFPAYSLHEFTVPNSRNKYIVYFYAKSRADIQTPTADYYCIVYADKNRYVLQYGKSMYQPIERGETRLVRHLHVYKSHFIARYNERFCQNRYNTSDEIICRFLSRSKDRMPIKITEQIQKKIEEYGDGAKLGFRVRDGFCFAYTEIEYKATSAEPRPTDAIDAVRTVYTTFMDEAHMRDVQIDGINEVHTHTYFNLLEDLQRQSIDGVVTLKLDE